MTSTGSATLCRNFASLKKGSPLKWVERYARFCDVELDPDIPIANAVRQKFTLPAWRILCRNPKSSFEPILRNRGLRFSDLVKYTHSLAEHGFQLAPQGNVLSHFIQYSYVFFDKTPSVPHETVEMTLLRIASKHGRISPKQIRVAHEWVSSGHRPSTRMSWTTLVNRATNWHKHLKAERAHVSWHFACRPMDWHEFQIRPLETAVDLWEEGRAMSTCLYHLRTHCDQTSASRFFSIRRKDRRYATLELRLVLLNELVTDQNDTVGRWELQDCRLACNRIPPASLVNLLKNFAEHYNQLAQEKKTQVNCPPAIAWNGITNWAN